MGGGQKIGTHNGGTARVGGSRGRLERKLPSRYNTRVASGVGASSEYEAITSLLCARQLAL